MSDSLADNPNSSKIDTQDHVLISIPLEEPLNKSKKEIIKQLEKKFRNNGFFFEIDNFFLHFYLKSLDFTAFREAVSKRIDEIENKNDRRDLDELFTYLFEKIGRIKSYGIKGKKRI